MLRLFASASIFVIALALAGLPARAQSSSDATSKSLRVAHNVSPTQQEEQRAAKSVACRKQAKEQKLSGSNRRAFLKDCIRKYAVSTGSLAEFNQSKSYKPFFS